MNEQRQAQLESILRSQLPCQLFPQDTNSYQRAPTFPERGHRPNGTSPPPPPSRACQKPSPTGWVLASLQGFSTLPQNHGNSGGEGTFWVTWSRQPTSCHGNQFCLIPCIGSLSGWDPGLGPRALETMKVCRLASCLEELSLPPPTSTCLLSAQPTTSLSLSHSPP